MWRILHLYKNTNKECTYGLNCNIIISRNYRHHYTSSGWGTPPPSVRTKPSGFHTSWTVASSHVKFQKRNFLWKTIKSLLLPENKINPTVLGHIKNFPVSEATSQFGNWLQFLYEGKCRVAFQNESIFVGDFDPHLEANQEYNLARVEHDGYQPDETEILDNHVPATPEAQKFLTQYYTNTEYSGQKWPALKDHEILQHFTEFSRAVYGVTILSHHEGLILNYSWEAVKGNAQLKQDLDLAEKIYQKIKPMGNTFPE